MAGGWTRDGAVQEQIDDTVKDAIAAARLRMPAGESVPGVRTCVTCQAGRDKAVVHSAINRRGSKDSQLR
jgi:hypothetical protein